MDYRAILNQLNCPAMVLDQQGKALQWNVHASLENGDLNEKMRQVAIGQRREMGREVQRIPMVYPHGCELVMIVAGVQGDITRSLNMLAAPPFFRTILDNSEIAITMFDLQGNIILFSHGSERMTGYFAEEMVEHRNISTLFCNEKERGEFEYSLYKDGLVRGKMLSLKRKDGSIIKVLANMSTLKDAKGGVVGAISVTIDMSREERLMRLAEAMVDNLPTGLAALDVSGRVLLHNQAFMSLLHLEAMSGGEIDIYALGREFDAYRSHFMASIHQGMIIHGEREEFEDKEGGRGIRLVTFYPVKEDGRVNLVIMRVDDITRDVQMERILVAAEKMNAVAGLAAGMAHEINNPLSGIIQSADLMRRIFNLGDQRTVQRLKEAGFKEDGLAALEFYLAERRFEKLSSNVLNAGERVSRIIGGLLEFSRKRNLSSRSWDVRTVVEKALVLARNDEELGIINDMEVVEHMAGGDFQVLADIGQLLQVLLHILHQSVENIAHRLKVETASGFADPPSISFSYEREENLGVIAIHDNGLPAHNGQRPNEVEPFFSTLKGVRGGLGLAVASFILAEFLQGSLKVIEDEHKGTTYKLYMPLA